MDLVGFVVCAGIAGVWGVVFDPEKLYSFLLFLGVICFIRHTRNPVTGDDEPASVRRIGAMFYAQGIQHGMARAESRSQERNGHLPRVG